MPEKSKGRAANGASSIYQDKNGGWHGRVTMGTRDDGRPDRRHVRGKTRTEVTRKVKALEKERDSGTVRRAGRPWTVEQWLTHWVDTIAAPSVRDNTLAGYRVAVRVHLVPGVGAHRLDKLEPEHLERLYARMQANGSAAGTAHQAHRTIRTALGEAVRRGHLARNPAALAKPPRLSEEEVQPYSVAEVKRILAAAAEGRNSARWAVALSLGLRQGEALGLKWADLDLDAGRLIVRRSRQRPRWEHGCGGVAASRSGYCPERAQSAGHRRNEVPQWPAGDWPPRRTRHPVAAAPRGTGPGARGSRAIVGGRRLGIRYPDRSPVNPRTDFTNWKNLW